MKNINGLSMTWKEFDDLIGLINKTFPDDSDNIAVITQLTTRDYETGDKTIAQSIVFGRLLEV